MGVNLNHPLPLLTHYRPLLYACSLVKFGLLFCMKSLCHLRMDNLFDVFTQNVSNLM